MNRRIHLVLVVLVCTAILAACSTPSTPPLPASPNTPESPALPPTKPAAPPAPTPEPGPTPGIPALSPEPHKARFKASDGQDLSGTYYPSSANPAPLVVLMHWVAGSENDWAEVAFWLQNRGLGGKAVYPKKLPWLDPSWFPKMPEGLSYAVFTFSFRGCEESGCNDFNRSGWLLDAQAAVLEARGLEGVDPHKVVAAGASIGADGAPDGCAFANTQQPGTCQGAFSFSPGGYLTLPYDQVVGRLQAEQPPRPAWCLYGKDDNDSAKACKSAGGAGYKVIEYASTNHGMELIRPNLEPSSLLQLLDFLKLTVGK